MLFGCIVAAPDNVPLFLVEVDGRERVNRRTQDEG